MNKYYNTKTKELERVARELRVMQENYTVMVEVFDVSLPTKERTY